MEYLLAVDHRRDSRRRGCGAATSSCASSSSSRTCPSSASAPSCTSSGRGRRGRAAASAARRGNRGEGRRDHPVVAHVDGALVARLARAGTRAQELNWNPAAGVAVSTIARRAVHELFRAVADAAQLMPVPLTVPLPVTVDAQVPVVALVGADVAVTRPPWGGSRRAGRTMMPPQVGSALSIAGLLNTG